LNNLAYSLAVNKKAASEALPLAEKAYRIAYNSNAQVDLDLGASLIAGRGTPVGSMPFNLDAYDIFAMKAQISDTLGWIEHLMGNTAAAQKHLAEAGEGAPYSAEVQYHIAVVEAALGRPAEAAAALNKAAALDPQFVERPEVQKLRDTLPRK
jgi:tetratricopeptide (TPR) repeat protein